MDSQNYINIVENKKTAYGNSEKSKTILAFKNKVIDAQLDFNEYNFQRHNESFSSINYLRKIIEIVKKTNEKL